MPARVGMVVPFGKSQRRRVLTVVHVAQVDGCETRCLRELQRFVCFFLPRAPVKLGDEHLDWPNSAGSAGLDDVLVEPAQDLSVNRQETPQGLVFVHTGLESGAFRDGL